MIRSVDLVVAGDGRGTRAAAVDVLRRGGRVLIVLRSGDARHAQRIRRYLRNTVDARRGQLSVMTRAEVVCVDGIDGVEAVVIRHATGRLSAVNASSFVSEARANAVACRFAPRASFIEPLACRLADVRPSP
jgi:thioredoxin reductase